MRPLRDNLGLEVFNEICTLMIGDFMITFSDWVERGEVKFEIGYAFIGLYSLNAVVNIIFILVNLFIEIYYKIKKFIIMRRIKKF